MQHIIKKQIIDLVIDHRLDAFQVQQQVSDLYWHQLVALLEKEFDKISQPGETICIDRLEIDLGVIDIKNIQLPSLHHVLLTAIIQQVQEHITAARQQPATAAVTATTPQPVIMRQPQAIHGVGQWLLYMQKGYLPWNLLQVTEAWLNQVLEALATDYSSVAMLCHEIQKNQQVVTRIVQQHTTAWLIQLITVLTARNQSHLPHAVHEMEQILQQVHKAGGTSSITPAPSRTQLWQQLLQAAAAIQQQQHTEQLMAAVIKNYISIKHIPVLQQLLQQPASIPLLQPVLQQIQQQLVQKNTDAVARQQPNKEKPAAQQAPGEQTPAQQQLAQQPTGGLQQPGNQQQAAQEKENKEETTAQEAGAVTDQPAQQPLHQPVAPVHQTITEEGGLFVQQAGLVLVHPFLRSFFSLCGFMEGRQFAHAANRQKAVYLLHYIATGSTDAAEHELVIPKILCNYPLEEPIEKETHFLPNELQEADDLLRAVIAQWSILKKTSPDGLRQGFLQRSGKLYIKNDQLYIEVEKNAIDVLLDHLPWNISIIKLPWIPDIIRVEWR